jgi:pheromone shutdown protein TraB
MTRILPCLVCIALWAEHRCVCVHAFYTPFVQHHRPWSTLSAEITQISSPQGTVVELKNTSTGQKVTLIGTAHLSQRSNDQVKCIIETVKPDVVMIELDPTRLERIGLTEEDLGSNLCAVDDIAPPLLLDDLESMQNLPWWSGLAEFCVDRVAEFARGYLTDMYNEMGKGMGKDGLVGGGEFLAAINAAKSNDEYYNMSTKIVLGDRNSIATLRRAVELAIRSGNPLGTLGRLASLNQEELNEMEEKLRERMEEKGADPGEVSIALVELLKSDSALRNRIFERLELEVPEFTRAFVTERDYIMAEAIRREIDARHIVAVVGLAHVQGISATLQGAQFQESSTTRPSR